MEGRAGIKHRRCWFLYLGGGLLSHPRRLESRTIILKPSFTDVQFARMGEKRDLRFVDLLKRARLAYAFSNVPGRTEITFRSRLSQGSRIYRGSYLRRPRYLCRRCAPKSISHCQANVIYWMIISRYVNQITCGSCYASQSSGDCIASKLSRRRPRIYRNLLHRLRFINFVFDVEACRLASAELRFLVHFFLRFVNRWLFLLKSWWKWKSNRRKAETGYTCRQLVNFPAYLTFFQLIALLVVTVL